MRTKKTENIVKLAQYKLNIKVGTIMSLLYNVPVQTHNQIVIAQCVPEKTNKNAKSMFMLLLNKYT